MFTRFTSMLHHAVEALAPNVSLQQEFMARWKSVTQYFVDVIDHKMSVDQTPVPGHLKHMLQMLVREEAGGEAGVAGPCMEYLLKERILETLYTLARTDCPPGMKQLVLQLFIKLLSHIRQPLLPHIHVHRPVQRLVKMCGEVKASPAETDEIQFLLTLCSVVKQDPYLVNFFIEIPKSKASELSRLEMANNDVIEICPRLSRFIIVDSLLNLMHSEDARVSVKACEGLMLISSLPEENAARHLLGNTNFTHKLTSQLCTLYTALPKTLYPTDIEAVDAKWGLDIASSIDDRHSFPGKRSVISFLSWLDFCDQLIGVAHELVAKALALSIHEQFLVALLEPAILQTSEVDAIMATAHLSRCLRLVSSPELITEFVYFILGHESEPEVYGVPSSHRLRQRLLDRCDHISEEVCVATWKLFEMLLNKPSEHVIRNLVLRNLVTRGYASSVSLPASAISSPTREHRPPSSHHSLPSSPLDKPCKSDVAPSGYPFLGETGIESRVRPESFSPDPKDDLVTSKDKVKDVSSEGGESNSSRFSGSGSSPPLYPEQIKKPESNKVGLSYSNGGGEGDGVMDKSVKQEEKEDDGLLPPKSGIIGRYELLDIRQVVSIFLNILPKDAISSHHSADSGYDSYLRDAQHQFAIMSAWHRKFDWPQKPVSQPNSQEWPFYEGLFLQKLLDKLSTMLQQSYEVNLQVTCVASRLALIPHANVHEFLLNPQLPMRHGCRNLPTVLQKLASDIQARLRILPDFQKKLLGVRHKLMGYSNNSIRRCKTKISGFGSDDSSLLAGVIVFEEFCKELAAIAFVKHHADTLQR